MTHLGLKQFPLGWCHLMREENTFFFRNETLNLNLSFNHELIHSGVWGKNAAGEVIYSFPVYSKGEQFPNGIGFSEESITWIKQLMEKSLNREVIIC